MKNKNNLYVQVESKEQAKMFRNILEAMGEPISDHYFPFNKGYDLRTSFMGNWLIGSRDDDKTCVTFGELIYLLQRKPLLISEDGVPLYEWDEFCFVNKLDFEIDLFMSEKMYKLDSKSTPENTIHKNHLLFSTKQAALEWIEAQKTKEIKVKLNNTYAIVHERGIVTFESNVARLSFNHVKDIYKAMEELQNA